MEMLDTQDPLIVLADNYPWSKLEDYLQQFYSGIGRPPKAIRLMVGLLLLKQLESLTDSIDTGTPSGRFFFNVMASLAQMERELIVERTKAGLEAAKKLGRKGGRKRVMTESKVNSAKKLLASGVLPKDVATNLGVSIATLYRWIPATQN